MVDVQNFQVSNLTNAQLLNLSDTASALYRIASDLTVFESSSDALETYNCLAAMHSEMKTKIAITVNNKIRTKTWNKIEDKIDAKMSNKIDYEMDHVDIALRQLFEVDVDFQHHDKAFFMDLQIKYANLIQVLMELIVQREASLSWAEVENVNYRHLPPRPEMDNVSLPLEQLDSRARAIHLYFTGELFQSLSLEQINEKNLGEIGKYVCRSVFRTADETVCGQLRDVFERTSWLRELVPVYEENESERRTDGESIESGR